MSDTFEDQDLDRFIEVDDPSDDMNPAVLTDEDEPEEDQFSQAFINDLIDKIMAFLVVLVGHDLHIYQKPFGRRIIESVLINDGAEVTGLAARQCLDGDTVVFRRDGTAVRLRNHEDSWSTGVKPTKRYKILGGGEVIATDNHPIMTDRGWVPAGLLRVGDQVAALSSFPKWEGAAPGVSVEHARLLGYLVTDGTWKNGQSPKFTNTRPEYLDEVEDIALRLFGITAKRYPKGNGYDLLLTGGRGNAKNPLKEWLKSLEFDHGFPTAVFSWPPHLVREFINRAWSGDGSACVKARGDGHYPDVFLAAGNDEVYTRYWQALLYKAGVTSTVKREYMTKGTGTFHRLTLGCSADNIRSFFDFVGPVFGKEVASQRSLECIAQERWVQPPDLGCTAHQRHLYTEGHVPGIGGRAGTPAAACVRCGYPNPRLVRGRSQRTLRTSDISGMDGEEFRYSRILAIEDAGEREVFDVEYPGKGWFVAQGVYVHNSGKSEVVADVVATLMVLLPRLAKIYPDLLGKFSEGLWVGLFAPVQAQAETLYGRAVSRLTSERAQEILADEEIDDDTANTTGVTKGIRLKKSGSSMLMMTANPRAKIESKSFHLIILDENQDMDDFIVNKSIKPMGAYYNATVVKTGTPNASKNNFYRSIQLNKRLQTMRGRRQLHFQWDWREVAKVNPNYAKFIKAEKLRIGEDSDEFKMSYMCIFLLERGMFVTSTVMDELGDTSQEIVRQWGRTPVVVGIDPARKLDSTVVTVVWVDWDRPDEYGYYDHRILNWLEIQGDDWEEQYFQIVNFLADYNVLAVGVDAGGVGDAVAQRLALLLPHADVIPVLSSPSEQSKRWKHLQALIQRKLIGWPSHAKTRRLRVWKRFYQQMVDLEKNFVGPNMMAAAPDEAHAHDDFADSLAIACAMTQDLVMPQAEQSTSPFYGR